MSDGDRVLKFKTDKEFLKYVDFVEEEKDGSRFYRECEVKAMMSVGDPKKVKN